MPTGRLNILHISDIHYRAQYEHDFRTVVSGFLRDLKQLCSSGLAPDIVVITGDLVYNADDPDAYASLYKILIEPLLEITVCFDRIFIVPGNHDAQRSGISATRAIQDQLLNNSMDRYLLQQEVSSQSYIRLLASNFCNFNEFLSGINPSPLYSNAIASLFYIPRINAAVVSANSAILTLGGLDNASDLGRLLLPEVFLADLVARIPSDATSILLSHHPCSWLAESCKSDFDKLVQENFSLHLCGHLHDAQPTFVRAIHGNAFVNQCGALFTDRSRFNGYSLISLYRETPHIQVCLRTYRPQRNTFGAAHELIDEGKFHSSKEAEEFFGALPDELCPEALRQWLVYKASSVLIENFDKGLTSRPLSELFVEPPLKKQSEALSSHDRKDSSNTSMEEIAKNNLNYMIYAEREYGKTTFLQQLALASLRLSENGGETRLPCMMNFADIKGPFARIGRSLRAQIPDDLPSGITFEKILRSGRAVLLFDDVDTNDHTRYGLLTEFVKQYPRCKYIFSARREIYESIGIVPDLEIGVPVVPVFMAQLSRKGLRQLIQRWNEKSELDTEALLNRVVTEIVQLNVPLTAVNGTIFLTIYGSYSEFRPINRATLIDRFIEILLQKSSSVEILRQTFDYRVKTHFLAFLAHEMVKRHAYSLEYNLVLELSRHYLDVYGFIARPDSWIKQFIDARILHDSIEGIRFRYRAFCEYFIALQIGEDGEFRRFILAEENCPNFVNEIEFFSGMKRDDKELLSLVAGRFQRLRMEAQEEAGWSPDLRSIESMEAPSAKDKRSRDRMFDNINETLSLPKPTHEERDALLQGDIPEDLGSDQRVHRQQEIDKGTKLTKYLLLYARVLRNSEIVPHQDKLRHLRCILEAWSEFTIQSFSIIPQLAEFRCVSMGGIRYRVIAPEDLAPEEVAERLYLFMPKGFSRLLLFNLGSEKLEAQLAAELYGEHEVEPKIVRFYRDILYADLRLSGFLDKTECLAKELSLCGYLREVLLDKLNDMYKSFDLSAAKEDQLRRLLARASADLYPTSKDERDKNISRHLQTLKRSRIINTLRISREP